MIQYCTQTRCRTHVGRTDGVDGMLDAVGFVIIYYSFRANISWYNYCSYAHVQSTKSSHSDLHLTSNSGISLTSSLFLHAAWICFHFSYRPNKAILTIITHPLRMWRGTSPSHWIRNLYQCFVPPQSMLHPNLVDSTGFPSRRETKSKYFSS